MQVFQLAGACCVLGVRKRCGCLSGTLPPGYTTVEMMVAIAIVFVLGSVAATCYSYYMEQTRVQRSIQDIYTIQASISSYYNLTGDYPESLKDIKEESTVDPWGNPYCYLRISDSSDVKEHDGKGKVRRDRNVNPINTDFDLYSMGKDGQTATQLNSQTGMDDIVRGRDGSFVGLAADF